MNWYSDLYLGKTAEKKKEALIQKIESGKVPFNTYLLTLARGEANQLEIVPAWETGYLRGGPEEPVILGIGCGRSETFELVRRITEEVFRETGSAELRDYFERRI